MGAAQAAQCEGRTRTRKDRGAGVERSDSRDSSASSGSGSAESAGQQDKDIFNQQSDVWKMPVMAELQHTVQNASPFMVGGAPGKAKGMAFVPTPAGGWSSFTAREARGRAYDALKMEVEYILKCIAWESDHGRTATNVYCASQERCELLAMDLRSRMFGVTNPVRTWYAAKAKLILDSRARLQGILPALPQGPEGEEYLLRLLYADPAKAEAQYAGQVGTFKIFVDVSLDSSTANGHSYFFGAEYHPHHPGHQHNRDSRLLLKVEW